MNAKERYEERIAIRLDKAKQKSPAQQQAGLRNRLKKYGLSIQDHLDMLDSQEYKCAICATALTISSPIDHCHSTGRTRDILCKRCNTSLGYFDDDTTLLANAISYLNSHKD